MTGNRTTTIFGLQVTDGGPAAPDGLGLPLPSTNFQGMPQPEEGLIVKFDGQHWRDEATGRVWDDRVKFNLPDKDVFTIDALANPPAEVQGGSFAGVGTVLFNMAVNPRERQGLRLEYRGQQRDPLRRPRRPRRLDRARPPARGADHRARRAGGQVAPRHLNKHIDYNACCAALPSSVSAKSLSQPLEMAVSSDGRTLYVAAFGSGKIGIFNTAALENDSFVPSTANQIELTGGGLSGLVLDAATARLYVLTRFDNTVAVVDTQNKRELTRKALWNPEPSRIKARPQPALRRPPHLAPTANRPAPAATSSATSTRWPGISAIRTAK